MTGWQDLESELDLWHGAGRTASLWWRDDDAVDVTAALERLTALTEGHGIPLTLAAIPARLTDDLVARVEGLRHISVAQHGWKHVNHAPSKEKSCEFGATRALADCLEEIGAGWRRIASCKRALPVFVPPWNRIDPALFDRLAELGLRAVSTFKPRTSRLAGAGLAWINTHADVIAWRAGRSFAGRQAVLRQLIGHLQDRRAGRVDPDEPTGILTHHLVHDHDTWAFLEMLAASTEAHPGARWVCLSEFVQR